MSRSSSFLSCPEKIDLFGFMSGYERRSSGPDDPVNEEAAARLGHLHDLLEASGYRGHDLAVFLVRLLFCLFADASGIFEKGLFRQFVEIRTAEDGSDLGLWLSRIFDVLNSPSEARSRALDEHWLRCPTSTAGSLRRGSPSPTSTARCERRYLNALP